MNKQEKIEDLKRKIDYEYTEEYRNVKLFRPLIKEVDDLSKTWISSILNSSMIKRLNREMQEYADIANYHQRKKIEYMDELRELEKATE